MACIVTMTGVLRSGADVDVASSSPEAPVEERACDATDPQVDPVSRLVCRAGATPHSEALKLKKPQRLAAGTSIAVALGIDRTIADIANRVPGTTLLSTDPPIVHFQGFLSATECETLIGLGIRAGLKESVTRGNKFAKNPRTSRTSWCGIERACAAQPVPRAVDARIANITGLPPVNLEYFQILNYKAGQEYHVRAIRPRARDLTCEPASHCHHCRCRCIRTFSKPTQKSQQDPGS